MASSAADRFVAGGGGAGEEQLLLLHHPQMYYHVPQHSRREKLRFPPEDQPPPAAPLLLLHEPSAGQTLYPAHSLTALLPSINSSSSSASPLYGHNPAALGYGATQFDSTLPIPPQQLQQQIHSQGVSLSLSSSPSPRPPPPRHHMATRPAPLGPFTGYAAVLNRSRFLEPARKLLEEVCHVGNQAAGASGRASQEMLLDADPVADSLAEHGGDGLKEDHPISGLEQQQWKKSRLLSMLDEVYKRYKQYYQQVQAVITSFESVAGLNGAAPYVSVALKALSKHFRHLKNIISDQLLRTNKGLGNEGIGREEMSSFGLLENSGYLHRTSSSGGGGAFAQPHVWRPQRGLPERAVSVLRSWLFEHFLHPYPTDVDKQNLAKQTGLTRNQVSNWFINARVRLWKPMVEEIHSLEMRQKNKITSAAGESHRGSDEQPPQAQPPPSSSNENPLEPQHLQHIVSNQFLLSRAAHGELTVPMPNHNIAEPVNLVSGHQHGGGAVSNGVSLTLGLPQNNAAAGVCFPLNVARRFGLEECNDAYLASAFGEQERQFGKDVGSRLLHDFVG